MMNILIGALIIFILRIADQTLATMRSLLLSKNKPIYSALIGLVESAIWIIAVSKVIKDIDDPILIIAYASGFSIGTILGTYVDNLIGIGSVIVKVFTPIDSVNVADKLREVGYAVTVINGEGKEGVVRICWCVVPRKKVKKVLKIINHYNPAAFITKEQANPISIRK